MSLYFTKAMVKIYYGKNYWLQINHYKISRFCSALSVLCTKLLEKGQVLKILPCCSKI